MTRSALVIPGLIALLIPGGPAAQGGGPSGKTTPLRAADGSLTLARGGKTNYVVAVGETASPAEAHAAAELGSYLGKITGAAFPVVKESRARRAARRILVGWTGIAARQGIDGNKLGDEEWVIRTVRRDLFITGGRPRGTLYGVYAFLERELGCHWLDESTEVVPRTRDLRLRRLDLRAQPAFSLRAISGGYYTFDHGLYAKDQLYRVRNMANGASGGNLGSKYGYSIAYGSPGGGHTFAAYAKGFPTNHPEYLSMDEKGRRIGAVDGRGPGGICVTHPEVRKLVLARLKEFIAADRQRAAEGKTLAPSIYAIGQNDNHWMCQCPLCKAIAEREGSESGPLMAFINELADGVRPLYPDIRLMTFAYSVTVKPPRTLKPRDNVIIRIAELNAEFAGESDLFHPITHRTNSAQLARLQAWSRIAKNLAEWDYWIRYNDRFVTPYAPVRGISIDLATFQKHKVSDVYVESEEPERSSFYALKRWLGFQLMQDPQRDPAPLIAAFMNGYYGAAAAKMSEYLRFLEDSIAAVEENLSAMRVSARPYLTLPFYLTCQRLLDEAEALCASDARALLHVRRERVPVDAGLFHMWEDLTSKLPASETLPFTREHLRKRYQEYRLEQMVAFRSVEGNRKGQQEVADELTRMRELVRLEDKKRREPPPTLRIPRALRSSAQGDPAKVDWSNAAPLVSWSTAEGDSTDQKLDGRALHDGRYLYLQLRHRCDGTRLSTPARLHTGDDWELFFARRREAPPYRQLAMNSQGDSLGYEWEKPPRSGPPKVWASGARVISRVLAAEWTVLLSIPLASLVPGGAKEGAAFYANFYRFIPSPNRELLAWRPTYDSSFHVLSRLAEVTLESPPQADDKARARR